MYKFTINTGTMTTDSGVVLESDCVAGCGAGLNNADLCDTPDVGPLPVGLYKIFPPYTHPQLGPICMNLVPFKANEMYGRSDFRIHGFAANAPKTSSKGCICAERDTRDFIADHLLADDILIVVAEPEVVTNGKL